MTCHRSASTVLAALLFAAPLAAQGADPIVASQDPAPVAIAAPAAAPATAVAPAPSLAPTRANAAVGVRLSAMAPADAPEAPQGSVGRNPAMMIVGGVALIAGAVIGGDSGTIIMIGGGLLGLYGLWQYLK